MPGASKPTTRFLDTDLGLWLAGAAAVTSLISIVASEILIAAAILASFRKSPKGLPVWPLGLWFALTIVPALLLGFGRSGFPQIKKLYWFAMLLAMAMGFRAASKFSGLLYGWVAAASLSSAWSLIQFIRKYRAAAALHQDFYTAYVADRITGLMGHWMTFSGQMMMVLILAVAFVLFSDDKRARVWVAAGGAIAGLGLLLAETRSMWGGAALGLLYLAWMWKRWSIVLIPVLAAAILLINPIGIRERAISILQPHGETDSNAHRRVTRRIGWEIIKQHPWFGVGLEQVGPRHLEFVPADIPLPLPEGYYGHLHNIYVHYAAERGVPAALALLWFLLDGLIKFARAARRPSPHRWLFHGAVGVLLAVMFGGYFEVNLGDSEVLALFLAVVGAAYAARYTQEQGVSS